MFTISLSGFQRQEINSDSVIKTDIFEDTPEQWGVIKRLDRPSSTCLSHLGDEIALNGRRTVASLPSI